MKMHDTVIVCINYKVTCVASFNYIGSVEETIRGGRLSAAMLHMHFARTHAMLKAK